MPIDYKTNNAVSADDLISVFNAVGWSKDKDIIVEAFKNSYYVTAYDGDTLVGFARAISDGYYYTGIYDVVVNPQYQGNGIGKHMTKMLIDEFKGHYFFLTYTDGKRQFYEKCGFRINENAMWIPK